MKRSISKSVKLFLSVLMATVLSCSDSDQPPANLSQKYNAEPGIQKVTENDPVFQYFLHSEEYKRMSAILRNPDIGQIFRTGRQGDFDGLMIHLDDNKGYQRELMVVLDTTNSKQVYPFVRLSLFSQSDHRADVKWLNRFGETLNDITVINGKITKLATFDLIKSAKVYPGATCTWNCSDQAFNSYYQAFKRQCESDWLCDAACELVGNCSINFIFRAAKHCFQCTVQGPESQPNDSTSYAQ